MRKQTSPCFCPGLILVHQVLQFHHLVHALSCDGYRRFSQLNFGQLQHPLGQHVPDDPHQLPLEAAIIDGPPGFGTAPEEISPVRTVDIQRKALRELIAQFHHCQTVLEHRLLGGNGPVVIAMAVGPIVAADKFFFGPADTIDPIE